MWSRSDMNLVTSIMTPQSLLTISLQWAFTINYSIRLTLCTSVKLQHHPFFFGCSIKENSKKILWNAAKKGKFYMKTRLTLRLCLGSSAFKNSSDEGRCGDLNNWVYCSLIDFILLIRGQGTFLCNSWGTAWVSDFIKVYSWAGTWNKVSWAGFYCFVHEA